jgi:CubicO group peptidase (beta-lactamase class C family)
VKLGGDFGAITSVVVSQAGTIVIEEYLEGDATTLRNTRSCTKTVAGMLLGIAIERGRVPGVDTTVAELLPARSPRLYPDVRKEQISLEDLLTMRSCVECDDWNPFSAGNEERMYPREDWVQFALDLPIRHGTEFSYCTAGVVLLGVALELGVGEPLAAFARRELFDPLEITDAEWQQTPLGQTSTAGGLLLASRSLLALGELCLRGGDGLLPPSWIAASTTPHARIDDETEYGYLWWLRSYAGERSFFMSGFGGNRVHVFPGLELVAVITSANFDRRDAHAVSDRLLVERILHGRG